MESTRERELGRFAERCFSANLPNVSALVDSPFRDMCEESTWYARSGRREKVFASENLPDWFSWVDSSSRRYCEESTRLVPLGRFGKRLASVRLPPSGRRVDSWFPWWCCVSPVNNPVLGRFFRPLVPSLWVDSAERCDVSTTLSTWLVMWCAWAIRCSIVCLEVPFSVCNRAWSCSSELR